MVFVARFNFPKLKPPVRAYLHEAGLDAYSTLEIGSVDAARKYFLDVFEWQDVSKYQFVLAAMWGKVNGVNEPERNIDFFGLSDIDENGWPGNPEVSAWVVKNGVVVPQKEITCGDTLIVLGEEEKYRRKCKNMADYSLIIPEINICDIESVWKG